MKREHDPKETVKKKEEEDDDDDDEDDGDTERRRQSTSKIPQTRRLPLRNSQHPPRRKTKKNQLLRPQKRSSTKWTVQLGLDDVRIAVVAAEDSADMSIARKADSKRLNRLFLRFMNRNSQSASFWSWPCPRYLPLNRYQHSRVLFPVNWVDGVATLGITIVIFFPGVYIWRHQLPMLLGGGGVATTAAPTTDGGAEKGGAPIKSVVVPIAAVAGAIQVHINRIKMTLLTTTTASLLHLDPSLILLRDTSRPSSYSSSTPASTGLSYRWISNDTCWSILSPPSLCYTTTTRSYLRSAVCLCES